MWLAALAWGMDTPEHVDGWREQIDWAVAEEEVTTWLRRYIEVDTVAPPGNERDGALFLESVLRSNGVDDVKLFDHGDNRASLVARLPGERSDGALCLLSHIDVVPSETDKWTTDPLKGTLRDGYLYGRGTLDMKGMTILEVETMVLLARLDVPLERDVVLLAVADEEVGGLGMQTMVDEYWDEVGCSHLINEGGLGLVDGLFEDQTLHAISVAEKGTLWFRMVAEGPAGHGSTIEEGEAPARLLEAMERLQRKYRPRPRIDPAMYELFRRVGRHRGGILRPILGSRLGVQWVVKPKLMGQSTTAAALTDTLHLTGMGGASSINVVPSTVWAQYDSRLLLGTDPDEQLARIAALVDDIEGIRFEVVDKTAANASPWDDPLFDRIAHYAVEGRPEAVAAPVLSPGFTDSIFARPLGVRAYGYVPFELDQDEVLRMHGHDERVSLDNLREGTRRLFSIVTDFCAAPGPVPPRSWERGGDASARRSRLESADTSVARGMVEAENTSWLRATLEASEGPVSSDVLWHVLHADSDPVLRAQVLERQSSGDMNADYARLLDRVLRDDGQPQRFGTVGACEDGVFVPEPTEHADHVDTHRADVGLGPLADACP